LFGNSVCVIVRGKSSYEQVSYSYSECLPTYSYWKPQN
jgi:hypothetical protein